MKYDELETYSSKCGGEIIYGFTSLKHNEFYKREEVLTLIPPSRSSSKPRKTLLILMEGKREHSSDTFTAVLELSQMGAASVPRQYILPPFQRPNSCSLTRHSSTVIPIIDMSSLHHPSHRSQIIEEVRLASKKLGFFQVINHGIDLSGITDAIDAASEFFDLPHEEKIPLASSNVHEPVRYGTSLNHVKDKVHYWRDFIKHYSHPISNWIDLWPSNPSCYRKKMGTYAQALHMFQKMLVGLVFESLGLNPNYLHEELEEGSQVMAVNCYPPCPEPDLVLGMPPHSDYGYLTILTQNRQGLEVMDHNKRWHPVPLVEGALIILLGDQMEVISNGHYKSPIHRAIVNSQRIRISIASLHSLSFDRKVKPAAELVDKQHLLSYREGSFGEFLDFLSKNDITEGRYIDTLRIYP